MKTVLLALATATSAATLALLANYLLFRAQGRATIKAERREFVRSLHAETVDLVVDLDLFIRSIRADVIVGCRDPDLAQRKTEDVWEGDLLRRVRHGRFGHPDPDVRVAIGNVEDAMWACTVMAVISDPPLFHLQPDYTAEERKTALTKLERALEEVKMAARNAPLRELPEPPQTSSH